MLNSVNVINNAHMAHHFQQILVCVTHYQYFCRFPCNTNVPGGLDTAYSQPGGVPGEGQGV